MGRSTDNDQSGTRSPLDRRQFGKILVAGLGGLTLGPFARAEDCPSSSCVSYSGQGLARPSLYPNGGELPSESTVDVVIVGAGLSGLIAARQMRRAGRTVRILEARNRIGGRMYGTTTTKFAGGYVDYGGQWVGPTQYHMQELVAELNITPFDSYEEGRSIQSWSGTKTGFNGDVSELLKGCTPPDPLHFPPFPERHLATCKQMEPPPASRLCP